MTLSVLCAMENQDASVVYFDTEQNFSAKRYRHDFYSNDRVK